MIIQENITVYKCQFCKKKLFRKHSMEAHEKWCTNNPENKKACVDCKFLESIKIHYTTFGFDDSECDIQKQANGFRCTKLDKTLYPLKTEKLGLPGKYPKTFCEQEPMPKECEHFEILW